MSFKVFFRWASCSALADLSASREDFRSLTSVFSSLIFFIQSVFSVEGSLLFLFVQVYDLGPHGYHFRNILVKLRDRIFGEYSSATVGIGSVNDASGLLCS